DLHYGLKGQDCLWPNLRQPFLDDIAKLHGLCGPWDAVLFTGDLVQSGEPEQFEAMQREFLDPLWARLDKLGSGDAKLLAVPGNHDLIRPDPKLDNPAAHRLLERDGFDRVRDWFWDRPACSYRTVIDEAFTPYLNWWCSAPHRAAPVTCGMLPGDFATTLPVGGRAIGIIALNTAFLQLAGGEYEKRLVWDARQLHALCPDGIDHWIEAHHQCLFLTHHGTDWLTTDARKHGETEIAPAGRFAAHLFGHMHETQIQHIRRGGSEKASRLLQGRSVFGMERHGESPTIARAHGYNAGRIAFDADGATLRLWPRRATNKTGGWRYIPDHEHADLPSDEGTAPDRLYCPPKHTSALPTPSGQPAASPSQSAALPTATNPLAEWTRIDQAYLNDLLPLSPGEVLSYFDGALPKWRHAVCAGIPRRHRVVELVRSFEKAREARAGCALQLIRAASGEGKSTLLLQAAADLVRTGHWTVLWREDADIALPVPDLSALDTGHCWLIVADDAENLVPALDRAASLLSAAGRTNVHFLLAARDVDWIAAQGSTTALADRLNIRDDLLLQGISKQDAKAIVGAWEAQGEAGLKRLAKSARNKRADLLFKAVRNARVGSDDGSLFGALLHVRFDESGLRAHLAHLMRRLRAMPIEGSTVSASLLDALLPVAACHAAEIPGIDERVLADLVGVPRGQVHTQVVNRLGAESTAVRSAGHVLTRHIDVAKAIVVEAERSLEIDLGEVWASIIRQTVKTSQDVQVGRTFAPIVHIGPRLAKALPDLLSAKRGHAIAAAAARAAAEHRPERLDCVTDLGRTHRNAGDPEAATAVFREQMESVATKVDYAENIRGYWYEWGVCEGLAATERTADAWLQGLSLSDYLNAAPITLENVKLICAGLGVAFGKLAGRNGQDTYALARRAAAWLGERGGPDAKPYFKDHHQAADALGTPWPTGREQAIAWLRAAVQAAGRALQDPFLKALADPDAVNFTHLDTKLQHR
ncbi:MAG TPA: metallophosphoesterase, partial [Lamprocystis sp. (in: g-proteobacteria)]|nr:metallophosphoesterase [Lamprocystis sp. (in: g-proteobacteria)]